MLTAAATAACAPRRAPTPTPVPAAEPTVAPTPRVEASPAARFLWSAAPRRLEVRTTVEIMRDGVAGAAEVPEQVRVVTYLSDTLTAGAVPGSVRALGVVDSVAVTASARVRGDAPGSAAAATPRLAPLRYQAASDPRGVRVDPAPDAGVDLRCTAPTGAAALGALAAVRETLPRTPAAVAPGAQWRDTTVAASCAGPVLLVVRTVSRYEAERGEGGLLAVVRRSTSTFRGQGAAGVRPVTVSGSGSGETRYLLDPARGVLASGAGSSRTALTVTVAGTAQRFVQRARTEVAAGGR